jgi:hypothetical protein
MRGCRRRRDQDGEARDDQRRDERGKPSDGNHWTSAEAAQMR